MKIYTKTGDDGSTGLFGGTRVSKDHLRIEAYGDVDELNSVIGCIRSHNDLPEDVQTFLKTIQEQLFVVGADLATPEEKERKNISIPRVTLEEIACLEAEIDRLDGLLPPLRHFILPGGSPAGAVAHQARTVCRRAERRVVSLYHDESTIGLLPMQYLNRLSDLLFVLARYINMIGASEEDAWVPNQR